MTGFEFFLSGAITAAVVYLFAATGELVAEKAGMLNLGVEGIMAVSAAIGFVVVYESGSHMLGFAVAGLAGVLFSLIYSLGAITFRASQVATGLALGVLGLGVSATIGRSYESLTVTPAADLPLPGLAEIPVIGAAVFSHDIWVYLAFALAGATGWVLKYTRAGLIIRAVGENPHAAQATGFPVRAICYGAVAYGGLLAGFAGAYASTVLTPLWADGMIAGRGWIAISLVVFGAWRTGRIIFGACLFGAVSLAELIIQALGVNIASQAMSAMPYVVTIIVLAVMSSNEARLRISAPFSLGKSY